MLLFLATALVFLFILSILVLIHEAGHYFTAKKLGIKVEEFAFGFPLTPPIFSIKRGETKYSFYPVLIGGFVKLYGEDEAGAGRVDVGGKAHHEAHIKDKDRSYAFRPPWQRFSVVIAGVVMNVILAIVIYYAFLAISSYKTPLPLLGDTVPHFILANQTVIPKGITIGKVSQNSPADQVGIKAPSVLLSINSQKITSNTELVSIINDNKGKEIAIEWFDVTAEKTFSTKVTPRVSPPENEGAIGIAFDFNQYNIVVLNYETSTQKLLSGFAHTYNMLLYNIDGLSIIVNQSVKEKNIEPISKNVGGPVMIFNLVGSVIQIPDSKEVILQILNIAGLLSISLAFFNVLPIPGLDGGRLFFIVIELVTGKTVNPKIEGYAHAIGMALLIGLIILITYKDIVQFLIK